MQHRLNRRGVMALVGGALAWPLFDAALDRMRVAIYAVTAQRPALTGPGMGSMTRYG